MPEFKIGKHLTACTSCGVIIGEAAMFQNQPYCSECFFIKAAEGSTAALRANKWLLDILQCNKGSEAALSPDIISALKKHPLYRFSRQHQQTIIHAYARVFGKANTRSYKAAERRAQQQSCKTGGNKHENETQRSCTG